MISILERFFYALVFEPFLYVQNMKRYSVTSMLEVIFFFSQKYHL